MQLKQDEIRRRIEHYEYDIAKRGGVTYRCTNLKLYRVFGYCTCTLVESTAEYSYRHNNCKYPFKLLEAIKL